MRRSTHGDRRERLRLTTLSNVGPTRGRVHGAASVTGNLRRLASNKADRGKEYD